MADSTLTNVGTAIAYSILMLSLVLLTGYGGFVSLASFAFAGVGAVVYCKIDEPNLFGIAAAIVVTAAVGALVAIPVLRLTGLYLALATLAFGQLMDKLFFTSKWAFEFDNPLSAKRPHIFGVGFGKESHYVVLMAVMLVLAALVVIAIRRGRLGRMLIAMRDSQAACGTLGLDQRWFRVGLFAGSAGLAGLSGALLAGLRLTITSSTFIYFNSLILLMIAAVWGVTSITGAVIGGAFMMYLPVAQSNYPTYAGLMFVVVAVGAVILGRNPNGLTYWMFRTPALIQDSLYPMLADRYPGLALKARAFEVEGDEDEALVSDEEARAEQNSGEVSADVVASR